MRIFNAVNVRVVEVSRCLYNQNRPNCQSQTEMETLLVSKNV